MHIKEDVGNYFSIKIILYKEKIQEDKRII